MKLNRIFIAIENGMKIQPSQQPAIEIYEYST